MPKFIKVFCVVFLLVAGGVALYYVLSNSDKAYTNKQQIRYVVTVKNTTNQPINSFEFYLYAPVKKTSTQICESIETSYPHNLVIGNFQNQILHFNLETLAPHASKIITVRADLLIADSNQKQSVGDFKQFTEPEEHVESGHRAISMEAHGLKNENLSTMVENISAWVANHIRDIAYSSRPHGALYAYNYRKGDCTEFMTLTMALLRANNIPARGVAGYICPRNMVLKPDTFHNWAEYHDGKTWRVVDPMNKKNNIPDKNYIAMRVIDRSAKEDFHKLERIYYNRDIGVDVSLN